MSTAQQLENENFDSIFLRSRATLDFKHLKLALPKTATKEGNSNKIFSLLKGATEQENGYIIKFFNHLPEATDGQKVIFCESVLSEISGVFGGTGPIANDATQGGHLRALFNVCERPSGAKNALEKINEQGQGKQATPAPTQKLKVEVRLIGDLIFISKPIDTQLIAKAKAEYNLESLNQPIAGGASMYRGGTVDLRPCYQQLFSQFTPRVNY
ncbi:hypothetical protein FGO68_gene8872 [Halteria grandinella]|uniref:Uncharacterized protein n=1 Tax=Halteria grandinella TaxID=5974 RepID=A0A8J8SXJ8_HALGN|nr:hypothetical protein FGO68_gene8872 [Halteria grandinella]